MNSQYELLMEESRMLHNLLARIHRDGGQHVERHGLEKSVDTADAVICQWLARDDADVAVGREQKQSGEEITRWRPEVVAFADAMEAKLRDNDSKGGWKNCTPHWLMMRLIGEVAELLEELEPDSIAIAKFYAASRMLDAACDELGQFGQALETRGNPSRVLREAADIANFAMMVASVIAAAALKEEK